MRPLYLAIITIGILVFVSAIILSSMAPVKPPEPPPPSPLAGEVERINQENKKKSEDFLAANKTKAGVVVRPSGLQYIVLKQGAGKQPKADDLVEVHYEGTLIDGTVFDSSRERGAPARFGVNKVIPGWTEMLQLMKEGGTCRVFIPTGLAYGSHGSGRIGPNEALIFEVELLRVL
jgi:FKBP-type peptidyl-prolyl cis-trans isomerase